MNRKNGKFPLITQWWRNLPNQDPNRTRNHCCFPNRLLVEFSSSPSWIDIPRRRLVESVLRFQRSKNPLRRGTSASKRRKSVISCISVANSVDLRNQSNGRNIFKKGKIPTAQFETSAFSLPSLLLLLTSLATHLCARRLTQRASSKNPTGKFTTS